MEHPLINNIGNLTLDELQSKISELNKKLNFAQRTNNGHLASQIRMALETYSNRYREKQMAIDSQNNTDFPDFSDKINIS